MALCKGLFVILCAVVLSAQGLMALCKEDSYHPFQLQSFALQCMFYLRP